MWSSPVDVMCERRGKGQASRREHCEPGATVISYLVSGNVVFEALQRPPHITLALPFGEQWEIGKGTMGVKGGCY